MQRVKCIFVWAFGFVLGIFIICANIEKFTTKNRQAHCIGHLWREIVCIVCLWADSEEVKPFGFVLELVFLFVYIWLFRHHYENYCSFVSVCTTHPLVVLFVLLFFLLFLFLFRFKPSSHKIKIKNSSNFGEHGDKRNRVRHLTKTLYCKLVTRQHIEHTSTHQ